MDEKEILIGKLILFLKRFNVYQEYIDGLAEQGSHGETIDDPPIFSFVERKDPRS